MRCRNYEHIVKTHQSSPTSVENQLPDELKFRLVSKPVSCCTGPVSLNSTHRLH